MKNWLRFVPLARVLVSLSAGIFSASLVYVPPLVTLITGIIFLLFIIFHLRHPSYRWGWITGVGVSGIMLLFGNSYAHLRSTTMITTQNNSARASGYVREITGSTSKAVKVTFMADTIFTSDSVLFNQKGIVYINHGAARTVEPGNRLSLNLRLMPVREPDNPSMFDYSEYLELNGYSFTAYADTASLTIHKDSRLNVPVITAMVKERLMKTFAESGVDSLGLGLLQSLSLGDKSDLDRETKQAFMNSGTMHLLAVSGLHAGIIYLLLTLIFPKSRNSKIKAARFFYIIICLWLYGLITGMSPSVLRAIIMMTVIETGRTFVRQITMANLLVVSFFIILLINPLSVYSAGLWLSYSAVAGIVWFYPLLYPLLYFRFPFFDWLWAMVCVSIAAQAGTLPFTFFYFHTFPVYFLINNLIMVPLLAPVLALSIVVLILSPIHVLAQIAIGPLNDLLKFMQDYVIFSEQMPHSLIRHIPFDTFDLILTAIFLLVIFIFISFRSVRILYLGVVLTTIFLSKQLVYNQFIAGKKEIVVFSVPGGQAVAVVTPQQSMVVVSGNVTDNSLNYALSGYLSKAGVGRSKTVKTGKTAIIETAGMSIALPASNHKTDEIVTTDILIVPNNTKTAILELYKPIEQIVLGSGMKPYLRDTWIKTTDTASVKLWDISAQGAYIKKIKQ